MHTSEKELRHLKKWKTTGLCYQKKLAEFKRRRNNFDKSLKKQKRKYYKGLMIELEECNTKDPNKFWEYIKKLGPNTKANNIPWEVRIEGKVVQDKDAVLRTWKDSFKNLYKVDE